MAMAAVLTACADPVAPPIPAAVEIAQAPPAIVLPGAVIDTISVRLLTAHGEGVSGWRVTWSGEGTVEPLDSMTDAMGLARARWTLPRYPGQFPFPHILGPSGRFTASATALGAGAASVSTDAHAFRVDRLDAASDYACGIKGPELWCWGGDPYPLGWSNVPLPRRFDLPTGVVPIEILTAQSAMCILDQDGSPWCILSGEGAVLHRLAGPPPLEQLDGRSMFAPSSAYICGLARDSGRPWCWSFDQDGTVVGGYVGDLVFDHLVVGLGFGCGLVTDGRAWCWGRNDRGQLGDDDTAESAVPVPVSGDLAFERITAGAEAVCASSLRHVVHCWGFGPQGTDVRVPTAITDPAIVGPNIFMGSVWEIHAIVAGDLRTWWRGAVLLHLFEHVETLHVVDVEGDGQTCVLTQDGQAYCSWILLRGGGDSSALSADLVPVPDPASVAP